MRVFCIILDSVGIGTSPDAATYGDEGAATLQHCAEAVGGLDLPVLQSLGLGNIPALLPEGRVWDHQREIAGVPPVTSPKADWGALREVSEGKDTITGHWEMAGLELNPGFHLFPHEYPSFPDDLVDAFVEQTGRPIIGNKAASGTEIIEALGEEHRKTGAWIVYTSADSVFQIAAHNDVIPLDELYRGCEIARRLCDPLRVGRVIARPFVGASGSYTRTGDRRDYAFKPDEPTVLERLCDAGIGVYGVGKIEDIFAHRGLTDSIHSPDMKAAQKDVEGFGAKVDRGLIFANFIDYDMLYGHRRDTRGYADALQQTDTWLGAFLPTLRADDRVFLTADHGNDPTFRGTDHTRELAPLLSYRMDSAGRSLGIRNGFYDIAQSLASCFGIAPMPRGESFLSRRV